MSDETDSGLEAALQFAEETLTGDLRDALLTHVRSMETPWSKLSEGKQQDKIDAIERMADDLVRKTIDIIAKRGFDCVPVILADFTIKDGGIKGKFSTQARENTVLPLADHQNKPALLVLTDVADFMGERAAAKADPDEPALIDEAA